MRLHGCTNRPSPLPCHHAVEQPLYPGCAECRLSGFAVERARDAETLAAVQWSWAARELEREAALPVLRQRWLTWRDYRPQDWRPLGGGGARSASDAGG